MIVHPGHLFPVSDGLAHVTPAARNTRNWSSVITSVIDGYAIDIVVQWPNHEHN